MIKVCKTCSVELIVGENWGPGSARKNDQKCRVCVCKRVREYAAKNREAVLQRSREYHAANREEANAKAKMWREANPEKSREITRLWNEANRDHVRDRQRVYAQSRPEETKKSKDKWRDNNRHKTREATTRRRSRVAAQTPADADLDAIRAVYAMALTAERVTGLKYHVDHIEPLALGGLHHAPNLVVMTAALNLSKGAQHWPWLQWFLPPA